MIDAALPRVRDGLLKYMAVMASVASDDDFFNDRLFQKKFNGFYRVRRCSVTWQPQFFALLGKTIKENLTFRDVLESIHENTGRYEASFASKLYATVYRTAPVIDSIVLANLELKLPLSGAEGRIDKICQIHQQLGVGAAAYLLTNNGKYLISEFRKMYPFAQDVTDEKALDLVLWQSRG